MVTDSNLAHYPGSNRRGNPVMFRNRTYMTLALWSEKRRASAEAAAIIQESVEAASRASASKVKSHALPKRMSTRRQHAA
jgi:hypothetical protein